MRFSAARSVQICTLVRPNSPSTYAWFSGVHTPTGQETQLWGSECPYLRHGRQMLWERHTRSFLLKNWTWEAGWDTTCLLFTVLLWCQIVGISPKPPTVPTWCLVMTWRWMGPLPCYIHIPQWLEMSQRNVCQVGINTSTPPPHPHTHI